MYVEFFFIIYVLHKLLSFLKLSNDLTDIIIILSVLSKYVLVIRNATDLIFKLHNNFVLGFFARTCFGLKILSLQTNPKIYIHKHKKSY